MVLRRTWLLLITTLFCAAVLLPSCAASRETAASPSSQETAAAPPSSDADPALSPTHATYRSPACRLRMLVIPPTAFESLPQEDRDRFRDKHKPYTTDLEWR